eukprot:TRINITY_DN4751_c0_g2_i1.p1 TRINITY_DN4751_c0_g2~~TRINITY_DN4751_c0_g2_i1.p1  ORF type:complete len:248 (+),score=36.07 TRINITY_DN4751_c0_g2_i1:82-825(+)
MINAYYATNGMAVLSWFLVRNFFDLTRLQKDDPFFGVSKEITIICLACVVVMLKTRRAISSEQIFDYAILYGKLACLMLSYFVSWRLFACYSICFLVLLICLPSAPVSHVPDGVISHDQASFQKQVLNTRDNKFHFVEMYTSWCPDTHAFRPIFSALARRYGGPNMVFSRVDLEQSPTIARDYDIDTSAITHQIPTIIMFQRGKELERLPPIGKGQHPNMYILSQKNVVSYFSLEARTANPVTKRNK